LINDILNAYGFPACGTNDDIAFRNFLNFANDLSYYAPTVSFAQGWTANCHVFFINEPNPFPGMFQGESTHTMDVTLLFQNLNDFLPPAVKENAVQLASDVFTFMYGGRPWPSCTEQEQGAKVFGPSSWDLRVTSPSVGVIDNLLSESSGRRRVMVDLGARIGFDDLAKAFAAFSASRN
jgi:hypothetical protein